MSKRSDRSGTWRGGPDGMSSRSLHVALDARRRYGIESELFGLRGRLLFGEPARAYALAERMNEVRQAARYPELALKGGELYAAALLHELMHGLIATVSERTGEGPLARARRHLVRQLGEEAVARALRDFAERFPAPDVAAGALTVDAYLASDTEGTPNPEVALEEALLVRLANANPALERMQELFDDAPLRQRAGYSETVEQLERQLEGESVSDEAAAAGEGSLMALLWAPQRASPTSLEGQLRVAQERWGPLLGERYASLLARALRSIDVLREERTRGPGGPGPAPVLDAAALGQPGEREAFSADSDWMGSVVLIAKSTYVWLAQLERRYGREVRRLDQIPDEALAELADRGFNGLWLIGLWERSQASQRIKQRRGQPAALASAYALYDYVIAQDLGGEAAFRELEARAGRHGIRLAGDMVPNHVGVDGRWVAEHPDWFVQLDHPPYPGYRFEGPDLSSHPAMAVTIEDHYWDDSDAAVVFKRAGRDSGESRFIYHGNDGTSMPWNDTAQLDYLKPEVREAVIQTILHVARLVPIIRFDAAMTLAKRHIQRLWYPPPGEGGAIPSRSAYGSMSREEFERRIPVEFWREVVDRVAEEAPGTLLLAEAFWMMEGYFVRTLGMHRVYNSAFMNMLKREENADYRSLIKNVLAFDPRILGRFVNFMNNPDEETAIAQFGDGDKYFGVCVLMATMPGLPMFGHGQVEGFREKYGMEYRAPTFEEQPDTQLVERHRREIAPLLYRRRDFSDAGAFRLFDAVDDNGHVNEDVYAYSNRSERGASLVLYNNRYPRASGRIHTSVPFAEPWAGGGTRRETLHEALGLRSGERRFTVMRDGTRGLSYLRRTDDLVRNGLSFVLDGFQTQVFADVFEVEDADGSYAGLADALAGAGVQDLEGARLDWLHREVRERFVALLAASDRGAGVEEAATAFVRAALEHERLEPLRARAATGETGAGAGPGEAEAAPAGPSGRAAGDERRPGTSPRGGGEARGRRAPGVAELAELVGAVLGGPASVAFEDSAAAPRGAAGATSAGAGASGTETSGGGAARGGTSGGAGAGRRGWEAFGFDTGDVRASGIPAAARAALALAPFQRGAELYASLRLDGALEAKLAAEEVPEPQAVAALPPVLLRLVGDAGGPVAGAGAAPVGGRSRPAAGQADGPAGRGEGSPRGVPEGADDPRAPNAERLLARVQEEPDVQAFLRVHVHEGERWYVRERYRLLGAAVTAFLAAAGVPASERGRLAAALARAEEASGYRFGALVPAAATVTGSTPGAEDVGGGAQES